LQQAFEARRVRVQAEADGIVPEEVVVLETAGAAENFIVAVRNTPRMEWFEEVDEDEEDLPPDEDFFSVDKKGERREDKKMRGRLFLVFSNQRALQEMLSLWDLWRKEQGLPRRKGASWENVFSHLLDVRSWGVRDRLLESGVLDDWRERVEHNEEVVPCEIELWFRDDPQQRQGAGSRVERLVQQLNGHIVSKAIIEEIRYHAVLARLPVAAVQTIMSTADQDVALVQCEQIRFFRATGQMAGVITGDDRVVDIVEVLGEEPGGEPVVALLDGLPLQNHRRLRGCIVVDDPDDFETDYEPQYRRHGTGMASLIVHGDLEANEEALGTPLYVRPILRPDPHDWHAHQECVPDDMLVVDLIHRAVRRLFDGEGEQPPAAQRVCVINLSIGIRDRLFDGAMSPLERLLDWLAWRYHVLFIVSAGNHAYPIGLAVDNGALAGLTPVEIQEQVLRSVAADNRHRRLLSPAEAVNALTVGAVHADHSTEAIPPRSIDPYVDEGLPSPVNAQGMGFRRAIKPEVLSYGSRVVLTERLPQSMQATLDICQGTLPPGLKVAAPGAVRGEEAAAWHTSGTSNAAALTSRVAARLYDLLDELRREPGGELIDTVSAAVWLKTLLTHGADWGTAIAILEWLLKNAGNSRQFKEYVTRLLGYGWIDSTRVSECTPYKGNGLGRRVAEGRSIPHPSFSATAHSEWKDRPAEANHHLGSVDAGQSAAPEMAAR
jgi:Subtilase family